MGQRGEFVEDPERPCGQKIRPARSWAQWPPPQKPSTGMPAARAAVTPGTLSSITTQRPGATPIRSAA